MSAPEWRVARSTTPPGSKQRTGAIVSIVIGALAGIAALIVVNVPLSAEGIQDACPSAMQASSGQTSVGQGVVNFLSGGACSQYDSQMTGIGIALLVVLIIGLIIGIALAVAASGARKAAEAAGPQWVLYTPPARPPQAAKPPTAGPNAAAGWYANGREGWERFWDGSKWTDEERAVGS